VVPFQPWYLRDETRIRQARHDDRTGLAGIDSAVAISPRGEVNRHSRSWNGMTAEVVQIASRTRVDIRFRAPFHVLVAVEQGARRAGETTIEGLPSSTLRDLRQKLTFVPAGHEYHEWHEPSLPLTIMFLYLDPAKLPGAVAPYSDALRTPRLFFQDTAVWETVVKIRRVMESLDTNSRMCLEALGVVLAHELARPDLASRSAAPRARGGLAGWQQRTVTEYIEANLADNIPLAKLAELARLSQYHFCRAFKQSFGVPPHRYHTSRRVERAKALLAKPDCSVTEIGMTLGFSETSSFTTVFRKATGLTPTGYRQGLA